MATRNSRLPNLASTQMRQDGLRRDRRSWLRQPHTNLGWWSSTRNRPTNHPWCSALLGRYALEFCTGLHRRCAHTFGTSCHIALQQHRDQDDRWLPRSQGLHHFLVDQFLDPCQPNALLLAMKCRAEPSCHRTDTSARGSNHVHPREFDLQVDCHLRALAPILARHYATTRS